MRYLAAIGLFLILAFQSNGGDKTAARPNDFLIKAAACNHAMVEYGKLAESRAASSDVKAFASDLVKGHQTANQQVAELLKTRKLAVVAGAEEETRNELKRLGGLEGAAFDRAFLKRVIDDHDRAIVLFDKQAKLGEAADVRNFASDTLPALRKHRDRAQEWEKTVK
jgi:putative membrane protein